MHPAPQNLPAASADPVQTYGYVRVPGGVRCAHCDALFNGPGEGSVMRSHARRCPVLPRSFPIPGVCDA